MNGDWYKTLVSIGLGTIFLGIFVTQKYSLKDTYQNEVNDLFRGADLEGIVTNQKSWQQKRISTRRNLGFDPNAAIANDLERISHYPTLRRITLHFKPTAECPTPYLKGRLSGPSLSMLKWTYERENHMMHGHYNVPLAGQYFLEINMLFCHNFEVFNGGTFDFKNICSINPLHMRLTDSKSYIKIYEPANIQEIPEAFWVHTSQMQTSLETVILPDEIMQQYPPMYTRYQPVACINDLPECEEPTSLQRFEPFEVRWNLPHDPNTAVDVAATKVERICLIGASHARYMSEFMRDYGPEKLAIHYFLARYPHEVTEDFIKEVMVKRCASIVMSFGQWSASFRSTNPWLFKDYNNAIRAVIELVVGIFPRDKVYIRAMHSIPIRYTTATCPPKDWRTPPVIDRYNGILNALTKEYGIGFIDTRFLMDPMWDSCEDWNHYLGKAGHNEALYVLDKITSRFSLSEISNSKAVEGVIA